MRALTSRCYRARSVHRLRLAQRVVTASCPRCLLACSGMLGQQDTRVFGVFIVGGR